MPLLFHRLDPKMLLFATNVLWKAATGGQQWEIISPDLPREHPDVPESVGEFRTLHSRADATARCDLCRRTVAERRPGDLHRGRCACGGAILVVRWSARWA
jgi:hypothetical protein